MAAARPSRRSVRAWAPSIVLAVLLPALALVAAPAANAATAEWTSITTGSNHTCAISGAGDVYCWGDNSLGQLGSPQPSAPAVDPSATAAPAPAAPPPPVPTPTPVAAPVAGLSVVAVASGDNHTCALSAEGAVLCWGLNANGQLGNGVLAEPGPTPAFSAAPVAIVGPLASLKVTAIAAGGNNTCAVAQGAAVYCWGDNSAGQLGIGAAGAARPTPTRVLPKGLLVGRAVTHLVVGDLHACALDSDGLAFCWGSNAFGQVGSGVQHRGGEGGQYLVPTPVTRTPLDDSVPAPTPLTISALSAGSGFTCAIATSAAKPLPSAYCWGRLLKGRLGNGYAGSNDTASVFTPTAVPSTGALAKRSLTAISSGGATTCVLDKQRSAFCWGDGSTGQVGNGEAASAAPLPPTAVKRSGPYSQVGLAQVSVSTNHACGLNPPDAGGAASCWGANGSGQLGTGTLKEGTQGQPRAVALVAASPSPTGSTTPIPVDPGVPVTPVEPASSSSGGSLLTTLLAFLAGLVVGALVTVLVMRRRASSQP